MAERKPDIDKLRNIFSVEYNRLQHPTQAFIAVNTRMLVDVPEVSEQDVFDVISEIIAENGIKHPLSEKSLRKVAKEIVERLAPSRKPFKVLIAKGKDAVDGKNGKVIWHFQKYNPVGVVREDGKVDFREKHFITAVSEGTVLLEVIKPTDGKSGYDVFDNTIPPKDGVILGDLSEWDYNPRTIAKENRDDRILYTAKREGALVYRAGTYSVDNLVAVKTIDKVRTGNVDASLNRDVVIKIGRDDMDHYIDDVIHPKMHVKARKVTINGNVGSHAVIEGEEVEINGTLQAGAKVVARRVVIRTCRGTVRAETVKVDLAEHADIEARDVATIGTAISSRLTAGDALIDTAMNFNTVVTARSLTVNNLLGESNTFSVNPMDLWWVKKEYRELKEKLADAFSRLDGKERHYKSLEKIHERSREKYEKLKILAKELTRKGKERDLNAVIREMKETKKILDAFESAKQDYDSLKRAVEDLQGKIDKIKNGHRYGSLTINGTASPGNKIVLGKAVYVIDDRLSRTRFAVKETGNGDRILAVPIGSS